MIDVAEAADAAEWAARAAEWAADAADAAGWAARAAAREKQCSNIAF